jgi:predicted HD superfamily hydrolase involved in NAD metabolism
MDFELLMRENLKDYPKRINHILGVKKRALELGKIYQADLEVLEVAALLHDITKEEPLEVQKKLIADSQILTNYPLEMYHAYSAAKFAADLGINDQRIIEAIKYHIFGKIKMNIETMIICVSDYCEENREFKAAQKAYQIALKNLTKAYLYSLKKTFQCLKKQNIKIHPEQIKTYHYYKRKKGQIDGSTH